MIDLCYNVYVYFNKYLIPTKAELKLTFRPAKSGRIAYREKQWFAGLPQLIFHSLCELCFSWFDYSGSFDQVTCNQVLHDKKFCLI